MRAAASARGTHERQRVALGLRRPVCSPGAPLAGEPELPVQPLRPNQQVDGNDEAQGDDGGGDADQPQAVQTADQRAQRDHVGAQREAHHGARHAHALQHAERKATPLHAEDVAHGDV